MSFAKICVVIAASVCFLIFAIPLSITSIVLAKSDTQYCDYVDKMGIDVKHYLLVSGSVSLVFAILTILHLIYFLFKEKTSGVYKFLVGINAAFGFAWFIVGAVILFRSNIECIREASVPVVYALVLWCISACSALNLH